MPITWNKYFLNLLKAWKQVLEVKVLPLLDPPLAYSLARLEGS